MHNENRRPTIAVILPCLNEGAAIADVVGRFSAALPGATVYVFDNGSDDDTAEQAQRAGAIVRSVPRRGKGRAIVKAFADVDADVYLMADGDGTYSAEDAPAIIETLLRSGADMVTGIRRNESDGELYRHGHRWGNRLLTQVANLLFRESFSDVLSGYRAFSRRFVKSFTLQPKGFEVEMMLTLHGAEIGASHVEVPVRYEPRTAGTASKLRTYRDGLRILTYALVLMKEAHPVRFFGWLALLLLGMAAILMIPIVGEYLQTGLVPRFPTLILATGIGVAAVILFAAGVVVDSISRRAKEQKRFAYLSQPPLLPAHAPSGPVDQEITATTPQPRDS
ncbi:MAG: glycosyltransferase [Gammaproteobacteria bacterium]|nr:glycosyltransferase [Gammaproteobacteria bacterium]